MWTALEISPEILPQIPPANSSRKSFKVFFRNPFTKSFRKPHRRIFRVIGLKFSPEIYPSIPLQNLLWYPQEFSVEIWILSMIFFRNEGLFQKFFYDLFYRNSFKSFSRNRFSKSFNVFFLSEMCLKISQKNYKDSLRKHSKFFSEISIVIPSFFLDVWRKPYMNSNLLHFLQKIRYSELLQKFLQSFPHTLL